jgi:hypothetical protein
MSNYKSVFDVIKNSTKGRYLREVGKGAIDSDELIRYDGEKHELDLLGLFERNILSGCRMDDSFIINENTISVDCNTVSVPTNPTPGLSNLSNTKTIQLDPFSTVEWKLVPEEGDVAYSRFTSGILTEDKGIMGAIQSMCNHMDDSESDSLPVSLIAEKLMQTGDMEHFFSKAYLMLQDCNVAAMFNISDREVASRMDDCIYNNISNRDRLGLVAHKKIVIDSEGFTGEEVDILVLVSQVYPSIKFCRSNIYNCCNMAKDDMAVVSSSVVPRSGKMFMSPQEMYRAIVSIACKLESVGDMEKAFSTMRGRVGHMKYVMAQSQDKAIFSPIRPSRCMVRALGGSTRHRQVCQSYPSYLCMSVAVVADLILSEGYTAVASLLVEELGGMGNLICPERPDACSTYQGLLRDYGLSNMQASINAIMIEWTNLGVRPYDWEPSMGWKEYITQLSCSMWSGNDINLPQVMFDIPYVGKHNTAWGILRNWTGSEGAGISSMVDVEPGHKANRDRRLRETAAFTWAMGVRRCRPKVFFNAYGSKEVRLSARETKWLSKGVGSYRLSFVSYTLTHETEGREDYLEETASNIIRTSLNGTKCNIVYSAAGNWEITEYQQEEYLNIVEAMGGKRVEEEEEIQSVEKGKTRMVSTETADMFEQMRQIFKPSKIRVKGYSIQPATKVGGSRIGGHLIDAVAGAMAGKGLIQEGEFKRIRDRFDGGLSDSISETGLAKILNDSDISLRVYGTESVQYGKHDDIIEVVRSTDGKTYSTADRSREDIAVDSIQTVIPPDIDESVRQAWFKWFL